MSEEGEVKKTSKLSSLISQAKQEANKLQIIVHYSENNWETNEEINLILDENTTISQLIEETKAKLTNKQNIDKKVFIVRIFKKKKKIPNNEYPVCNLESKVKDYGKSHFCLVEEKSSEPSKNEEEKEEEKKEEKIEEKKEEKKEEKIEEKKEDNNKKTEIKKENEDVIFFSGSFLSFSLDESVAQSFISGSNNNNMINCKFIIDKGESPFAYNIDVKDNSKFQDDEREVLFLPLSCFIVKKVEKGDKYFNPNTQKTNPYIIPQYDFLENMHKFC